MTNERLQELKRKVNGLAGKSDLTYQDEVLIDEIIDSAMNKPDCSTAEWCGGKCCGYGKAENDDEPIDACKACPKQTSYGVE